MRRSVHIDLRMRARTVSTLIVGSRATCPVGRPFATHTLTSSSGVRPLASSRWTRQVGGLDHAFHRPVRPQNNNKNTRFAAFEDADVASSAVDAAASVPAPDDPVVSVMFTLAVVALSVLTLGVAYLSISSFLDQRQEEEVRCDPRLTSRP